MPLKNSNETEIKNSILVNSKLIESYTQSISKYKLKVLLANYFSYNLSNDVNITLEERIDYSNLLRKATSFVLMVQIIISLVLLKKHEKGRNINLLLTGKIQNIVQLKVIFQFIVDQYPTLNSLYEIKVLDFLDNDFIPILNKIIDKFSMMNLNDLQIDILGKIFQNLLPFDIKKVLSIYYTSNNVGQFLAYLSIKNFDEKILDPSCGSGTILVSAYQQKEILSSSSNPERIINTLFGIEVSTFAAILTKINLLLQNPSISTDLSRIIINDAFKVKVGRDIPKVDVIIGNPPFTRGDLLNKNYKNFLESHLKNQGINFSYNKKYLGLFAYFLLDSTRFLKTNGILSLILPLSLINSSTLKPVIDYFMTRFSLRYIISSDVQTAFSEDCSFREIILIAQKDIQPESDIKFITLKEQLTEDNYQILGTKIKTITSNYEDLSIRIRPIPLVLLSENKLLNWTIFFYKENFYKIFEKIRQSHNSSPIKDLVDDPRYDIDRGFRAGISDFFYLPNKYWKIVSEEENSIIILNTKKNLKLTIPRRFLRPALRKSSLYQNIIPSNHYYLVIFPPESKNLQYINWGKEKFKRKLGFESLSYNQIKKGRKIAHLALPHELNLKKGRIMAFFTPKPLVMSDSFIFIRTNNQRMDKILAAYFNSTIFLLTYIILRREKGGNLSQIFGVDTRNFFCLNPANLTELEQDEILTIFDKFIQNSRRFPSFSQQVKDAYEEADNLRYELDLKIYQILGLDADYITLSDIYEHVLEEFNKSYNK